MQVSNLTWHVTTTPTTLKYSSNVKNYTVTEVLFHNFYRDIVRIGVDVIISMQAMVEMTRHACNQVGTHDVQQDILMMMVVVVNPNPTEGFVWVACMQLRHL